MSIGNWGNFMDEDIIRVEFFQPFAQYRNPFTFYYAQSFPLPPPSTIYGMIGYLIDEYYAENISQRYKIAIMGRYESSFFNYTGMIKASKIVISPTGQLLADKMPLYFSQKVSQRTPVHQTELFNVHLILFFKATKTDINKLKEGLQSKVFTIGRGSDIAAIRDIEEEPKISKTRYLTMNYGTYAPKKQFEKEGGKLRGVFDIPVYFLPIQQSFINRGERIRSVHQLNNTTERNVNFEKTYFLPFGKRLQFESEVDAWVPSQSNAVPILWWSDVS